MVLVFVTKDAVSVPTILFALLSASRSASAGVVNAEYVAVPIPLWLLEHARFLRFYIL